MQANFAAGAYDKALDPYLAMSMLMGGMCQLTAVWLLYDQPYDTTWRSAAASCSAGWKGLS